VLWLGRRRSARLSRSDSGFESEDVFFEEALTNDLFQVLLEALAVDDFAPHTVGKSNILLLLGGGVVMNWSRTSDPWLDLDNVEDLVDGESQRSEVFC